MELQIYVTEEKKELTNSLSTEGWYSSWRSSNQCRVGTEGTGSDIELAEFEFLPSLHKLCDFRHITWSFLYFSFFCCKMGIMIVTISRDFDLDYMLVYLKHLQQFLPHLVTI